MGFRVIRIYIYMDYMVVYRGILGLYTDSIGVYRVYQDLGDPKP